MDSVLVVSYFLPLAVLVGVGPYVAKRYGARAVAAVMLTTALSAGLMLAILGGQHQRNLTMRSSLVGMLVAGFFFSVIIALPTYLLVDLGRHGATRRKQVAIPLLMGIAIQLVAAIPYFLGIGCALAGACM